MYQKPVIHSESIQPFQTFGQYIFEITPACQGLVIFGAVSNENGVAYCSTSSDSSYFADITCENISGTYHAVYGDSVPGGGASCTGPQESFIYPLLSVSPDLPADCIINSYVINDSFDECDTRGV